MKIYLLFVLVLDAQVVHDEGLDVGVLVDDLADGFAVAVACLAVDADEFGLVAGVAVLQLGGILETVGRHDAVVMVTGGYQDGGVGGAVVLDGVQR